MSSALECLLPNLDKQFYNFELGLDVLHNNLSSLSNHDFNAVSEATESIDHCVADIVQSQSETSNGNVSNSDDDYISESESDTDEDLDIYIPPNTPSNMRGIYKKTARKKRVRQRLVKRNMRNNPNPRAATDNNSKPVACPWEDIEIPKKYASFVSLCFTL